MGNKLTKFTCYPQSHPRIMSQGDRDESWCRIQAGVQLTERGPIRDLTQDEEIARTLDLYRSRYKGELRRLLMPKAEQIGEFSVSTDMTYEELELLVNEMEEERQQSVPIEPSMEELLRIPTVRELVQEQKELFEQYDATCQEEYAKLDETIKKKFRRRAKKKKMKPWEYYRYMRKFYFRKGITDPPKTLNKLVPGRFLDRGVSEVDQSWEKVLRQAETELAAMKAKSAVSKQVTDLCCFVPRPLADESSLSAHALGRAMDVDYERNPHLKGKTAKAIDSILDWLQAQGEGTQWRVRTSFHEAVNLSYTEDAEAEMLYDKMQEISESIMGFLKEYLDAWENGETSGKPGELEAIPLLEGLPKATEALKWNKKRRRWVRNEKELKRMREIRDIGLITIPLEFFKAIKRAGALSTPVRLGIEYEGSKDTMHFEIMPPIPRLRKPSCVR